MKTKAALFTAALAVMLLAGCSDGNGDLLTGTWKGTCDIVGYGIYDLQVTLVQDGGSFSGTGEMEGVAMGVTGTLSGDAVSARCVDEEDPGWYLDANGTVAGDSMSGSFRYYEDFIQESTGTFLLVRQ